MEKKQVFGVKTGIFKKNDGTSFSRVFIELNGKSKYHTFQLQEPCRVVIDIENAVLAIRKPDFPVEDGVIERVRLFQFTPSTVRVVLDLLQPFSYEDAWECSRNKNATSYKIMVGIKREDQDKAGLTHCPHLQGKVILVDPGHGGRETGVSAGGLREKDVALDVALRLRSFLEQAGARVHLTRAEDSLVSLNDRINKANEVNADIFLSVHCQGFKDKTARGLQTYHFRNRGVSKVLATLLLEELTKVLGWPSRGVKVASFLVLRQARISATLVEVGVLTNDREAALLAEEDTRRKIAEGLARGIIRYFTELV